MILIVGATGQLGTMLVRRLAASGQRVRAFVRPTSNSERLRIPNVELVFGDLRDAASLDAACVGADVVISTANAVVPRAAYTFDSVESQGYRNLLASAKRAGVKQFIFMSVPVTPHDEHVPTFRYKRLTEKQIVESGVPYTIFRGSLFMDDWFALIGSSIPLRGSEAHTLERPFWFSRAFMSGVGQMIEKRGMALIPGSGKTRHSFIALDDVASFIEKSVGRPDALNSTIDLGGPAALSWDEVAALFGKVLGHRIRAMHTPAGVFRFQQALLGPLSPAAANLMGMNWLVGSTDIVCDTSATAARFGVTQTSAERFLTEKSALRA
jgi:uncharacterized protein YbjT (DUF2867 family)